MPPESSHADALALAMACADGDPDAWERFVREYQPVLRRAAAGMDPTGRAREVADELFAELYGLRERDGARQSLFRYFQGRSSLATWLRAVLAQRYVDRIRASRRTEPLEDDDSLDPGAVSRRPVLGPTNPEEPGCRAAVSDTLTAALAALAPRDRLRLRCYYTQDLTLAAIGALFGEHEATASRQLARVRKDLRAAIEIRMQEHHGYSSPALAECLRLVMTDAGDLDLGKLLARSPDAIVQNEEDPGDH
jgi:RNA polymerase sigma-70 factor (ECF subfamily)